MTKHDGQSSQFASRGRRQRPTASTSVPDAKAKFFASVSRGVECLMQEFGYSRERAQTALMLEITRGDNSPPADNEVFEVMSAHGLGMKDAATALSVSKALQRETADDFTAAIDELTSKLSVANLLKIDRGASPVPASAGDELVSMLTVPSIERVVTKTARQQQKTTIPSAADTSSSTSAVSTRKSNKNNKQKGATGAKKRSSDDLKALSENTKEESTKAFNKRERSDSLTEVVNAKFADKKKMPAEESKSSSSVQQSSVARSKRVRGEDADASQNAMKRSRTASGP